MPTRSDDSNRLHVLVVDDVPSYCVAMSRLLRSLGHTVELHTESLVALDAVEQGRTFDLLISDLAMPKLDGFELAARVRRHLPTLPVLYVSGQLVGLTSDGPDGSVFLGKPFGIEQLRAAIGELAPR